MALPASWYTHDWIDRRGQKFTDAAGKQYIHCHCKKCGRDFLRDPDTDTAIAIHVGGMSYEALEDDVSDQWLNEACSGNRFAADDAARKRIKGS
jgi:hypothetical protein